MCRLPPIECRGRNELRSPSSEKLDELGIADNTIGTLKTWSEPFVQLRVPKIFNLRRNPYERADITSNTYYDWLPDHAFILVPAQVYVGSSWRRSGTTRRARRRRASTWSR